MHARTLTLALALLAGTAAPGWAQAGTAADTTGQVVLTTGKLKPSFFFDLGPGSGCAMRFAPPATGPRRLVSVQLHFNSFGSHVAQGQVQLRITSVSASGAPAPDNLLPQPLLVDTRTLQALDRPLTLSWPAITVPNTGFFVVLEGLGDAPDEYVRHIPTLVVAGPGNYQVVRRGQPDGPPRLLSIWSVPELRGARPTAGAATVWLCGGPTPNNWQADSAAHRVPLLSVGFR